MVDSFNQLQDFKKLLKALQAQKLLYETMNKEMFEAVMKLSLSLTSNQIFLVFSDNTARIEEKIGKRENCIEEV